MHWRCVCTSCRRSRAITANDASPSAGAAAAAHDDGDDIAGGDPARELGRLVAIAPANWSTDTARGGEAGRPAGCAAVSPWLLLLPLRPPLRLLRLRRLSACASKDATWLAALALERALLSIAAGRLRTRGLISILTGLSISRPGRRGRGRASGRPSARAVRRPAPCSHPARPIGLGQYFSEVE
jgi:hypothetical protein